jgi:hypothetical protein
MINNHERIQTDLTPSRPYHQKKDHGLNPVRPKAEMSCEKVGLEMRGDGFAVTRLIFTPDVRWETEKAEG